NVQRARADTALATYPYKGSAYGYVGFNLAAPGDSTKPHPLFGDRDLRRALVMATDRERVLRNVFGDLAKVPPGPLSQVWWIWDPEIRELPYDSEPARAGRFDALLNVWNTDPTPSSGFPQTWTPAGFGRSNYGRYDNPEVNRLVDQAVASAANRDQARRAWRAAVEALNRDAPGIFLFATSNVAGVHKRIADVTIRPDS